MNEFFWLHIKKCGGQSFRDSFSPHYIQTNRSMNPKPFIALPRDQWNDTLNNYRIPLGEYDYKRMLFAKKFLYSEEEFEKLYKFTIVRNPYDRAVSLWKYLIKTEGFKEFDFKTRIKSRYSFSFFLDIIPIIWETKKSRSFATHTAPIWQDITDNEGNVLLDDIYELEKINDQLSKLSEKINQDISKFTHINKSSHFHYRKHYNKNTKKKVESLYYDDINNLNYTF